MGDEFDAAVDTAFLDGSGIDAADPGGFSDPVDIGSMMDETPSEPMDGFAPEPLDGGFDADLPAGETDAIGQLMDEADGEYEEYFEADDLAAGTDDLATEADTLDPAAFTPTDIPNGIEGSGPDAAPDIAAWMDEGALDAMEDTAREPMEMEETAGSKIGALMDEAGLETPDALNADTLDTGAMDAKVLDINTPDAEINAADDAAEIDLLMSEPEPPTEDLAPDMEELPSELSDEAFAESADIASLMNEPSAESADIVSLTDEPEPDEKLEKIQAEKEELLSLKEHLLAYPQEQEEAFDQTDGVIVKVLKKGESDTSVVYHDHDEGLSAPNHEISEWQNVPEEWAAEFNEEWKPITEISHFSDAERDELNKENDASQLDAPGSAENLNVTDVPKLNDVSEWISDINPNYDPFDWQSPYANNCGSCAFAVEQRLDGNQEISATSENIGTIEEMNKATGMEQIAMSPDEIREYLISQGPGAHGIVGIDRVSGPGHWFNAYYNGEKVVAIDGQTGEINDWPPDYGNVTRWDLSVRKETP